MSNPFNAIVLWSVYTILSAWRLLHNLTGVFFLSDLSLLGASCMLAGTWYLTRPTKSRLHVQVVKRISRALISLAFSISLMVVLIVVSKSHHFNLLLLSNTSAVVLGVYCVTWATIQYSNRRHLT